MSTTAVTPQANQQSNVNVMAANEQARRLLIRRAVEMTQQIYSNTVVPTNTQIINVVPRNVGIIKRFIIEISGTVTNNGDTAVALTDRIALSALLSNVTFYDLQNNLRINTTGSHLYMLASMKRQRYWLSENTKFQAITTTSNGLNVPGSYGSIDETFTSLTSIPAGQSGPVRMFWEVPLAYSDDDLRGAVFANVVNTTMSLQLTLNTQLAVSSAQDNLNAVYWAEGIPTTVNVSFDSATINIYQIYLDQLPSAASGQLILPNIDLATVYQITNTTLTGITPEQDYPIPFANFRDFFSVLLYYWPGKWFDIGSDAINYFSLTTANFTNIYKYDAYYARAMMRDTLRSDLPRFWYYFSSRRHPIWTTQFGNQQINVNANTADTGAYLFTMWEAMALQNTLVGSASLPAGG